MKKGIIEFYQKYFQKRETTRPTLIHKRQDIFISEMDYEFLVAPFTEAEVKGAIWDCDGSKNPGLDRFIFNIIRELWSGSKRDILRMISEFHKHGKLVRGKNSSFIVLIPKKEGANGVNDFRPISLNGGVYKIVSKILSKRLNCVLDSVISVNQSAFVGGRQIFGSIVMLNEARKMKMERLFFKINFEKAYNSVDWNFLRTCCYSLNFTQNGGVG